MYLSLTLLLVNMLAVIPPVMPSDQVAIEKTLNIVGDRSLKAQVELSNELEVAQQPTVKPPTPATPTTKELTFQEEIDKKISIANQYRVQKNFKRESEVFTGIGFYHLFFGAPRKGLPYIESALKVAQSINDPVLQCFALSALGDSYKALGEYQQAQESYRQSIATFQKVTKIKSNTSILLRAMYGIAAINDNLGETRAEFKYLIEALKISRESGDVQLQATALRTIRTHYFKRGYFEQALQYSKEASGLDPNGAELDGVLRSFIYPSNDPVIPQKPAQKNNQTETG